MDRLIYTAMTGAKATMGQQAAVAHNMANAATNGFRTEMHKMRAVPVQSNALPSRAFVVDASIANDFSEGPLQHTGRVFDMAVQGKGWFAVRTPNGGEAYTRNGSFALDPNGVLRTRDGLEVAGDAGQISIPPDNEIEVAGDGSITAIPSTGSRNAANVVGRLKMVNPDEALLVRGDDGLFRLATGAAANRDENVRVAGGYLEGSNVNVVEQMVTMISLARNFEMHTKMLQTAQENDRAATRIITT